MELPYLEAHLVNNCNLKCKGCSHFSPLFPDNSYVKLGIFERDLKRLQALFDNIAEIRLMGGEPLLHPQVLDFFEVVRDAFPDAVIALVTNGILLLKQKDEFWANCSDKNILIQVSQYPIELHIRRIKEIGKYFNVNIEISSRRYFFKKINLAGDSELNDSFEYCQTIFKCGFLQDGKISPCSFPLLVHVFNNFFEKKIPLRKNDFIDIHQPDISGADVLDFLNSPIPMCQWCLTKRPIFKWGTSNKKIDEWVGSNSKFLKHYFMMHKFRIYKRINSVKTQIHKLF